MSGEIIQRAFALQQTGRVAEAQAAFASALASLDKALAGPHILANPALADPNALLNRGAVLLALGRYQCAVDDYDRFLALRPDAAAGWGNRADALVRLRRWDEAVAGFDRLLALSAAAPPARRAEIWRKRAAAQAGAKAYDAALESYDRALALNPSYVDAWNGKGVALQVTQRFDAALAAFERSLALAPGQPQAQLARSKVLCEMGRVEEGMAVAAARATALCAAGKPDPNTPEPQARHDAEQRAWLAGQGVAAPAGGHHIEGGARLAGPAVNPANAQAVAAAWAAGDPKIVVIDDLLTPPALEAMRRFAHGSTVWRRPYPQGYLGAFDSTGFAAPLLAQIADELRAVFPSVIGQGGLVTAWGFKYDSRLSGIRLHADQAEVNVNFWLTPDEANLDPEGGGMVIWDKAAPLDWDIDTYNADGEAMRAFLDAAGARAVRVPYRANRAVIFDSDLFHETDVIRFAEGYENRRVNVTMLYGRRTFTGR